MKNKNYKWGGSEFSGRSRSWDSLSDSIKDPLNELYDLKSKEPETLQEAIDYIQRRTESDQNRQRGIEFNRGEGYRTHHKPLDSFRDWKDTSFDSTSTSSPSTSYTPHTATSPVSTYTSTENEEERRRNRELTRKSTIKMFMDTLGVSEEEAERMVEEKMSRKRQKSHGEDGWNAPDADTNQQAKRAFLECFYLLKK